MKRIVTWSATAALALSPLALAASTAQVSASPTSSSAAAKSMAMGKSYKVTAKANLDIAVSREDKVKIKGRVSPKAAGQKVILQQRVGNKTKWKATGNAKIKKNGTFRLQDKPRATGSREYRVLKPGAKGITKGVSKTMKVVVYAWDDLSYDFVGPKTNVVETDAVIGTERYWGSIITETAGAPASAEYTLGRKCIAMRASYGLTDSSETGASGTIVVSTDGKELSTHNVTLGNVIADQTNDLTGAYRVKFTFTTSASPAAVAVVATPEVLCTS